MIRSLDYLRRRHSPDISKTITFFRNNRQRMNYAECKAAGLVIASGIVASTNKSILTKGFKGPGMRCCMEGGQAIITLRALALSGRFDRAWNALAANDNENPTRQVLAA